MANVKITDLTALSGALVGADLFEMVDDVAGTPASRKVTAAVVREFTNMAQATGTDADTTMAVNTLYTVDMSAWATADRTYTLPATAAVGDQIGIVITAGDASHELIITAGSGDTLNGIAGGTEWSRVFITNEVVIMRCVVANATWMVVQDGRIPQKAKMYLSTSADGEAAGTYTLPTSAATPGAWTDEYDNGNLSDTANSRLYGRRGGLFIIAVAYAPKDAGTTGGYANLEIRKNGSTVVGGPSAVLQSSNINRITAIMTSELPAGEYFNYYYRTGDGGIGCNGTAAWICTFSITEVLP